MQEESEGIEAIKKLQKNELRVWTREELEESDLSAKSKSICYHISRHNSFKAIPSTLELRKKFDLTASCYEIYDFRKKGMAFNVTIPEIIRFYGPDYIGIRMGSCWPPPHLKWFGFYLREIINEKRKGDLLTIEKMIEPERVRAGRYIRHWIALAEDERGLPCYLPLGLHIPKEQISPLTI